MTAELLELLSIRAEQASDQIEPWAVYLHLVHTAAAAAAALITAATQESGVWGGGGGVGGGAWDQKGDNGFNNLMFCCLSVCGAVRRAVGDAALGLQQAEGTEQRDKQERMRQWLHSQVAQTDSDSERQVRRPALTVNTHTPPRSIYVC